MARKAPGFAQDELGGLDAGDGRLEGFGEAGGSILSILAASGPVSPPDIKQEPPGGGTWGFGREAQGQTKMVGLLYCRPRWDVNTGAGFVAACGVQLSSCRGGSGGSK